MINRMLDKKLLEAWKFARIEHRYKGKAIKEFEELLNQYAELIISLEIDNNNLKRID